METNDSGNYCIDVDCYCRNKEKKSHCEGNLYIQPDHIENQRLFMVSVIDTRGNDQGNLWLTADQLLQVAQDINILVSKYRED